MHSKSWAIWSSAAEAGSGHQGPTQQAAGVTGGVTDCSHGLVIRSTQTRLSSAADLSSMTSKIGRCGSLPVVAAASIGWQAALEDVDFRSGQDQLTDLGGADFRGADLSFAQRQGVQLRGADLRVCCLDGANFNGADLRQADLRGFDLSDCHLDGADQRQARLDAAALGLSVPLSSGRAWGSVGLVAAVRS